MEIEVDPISEQLIKEGHEENQDKRIKRALAMRDWYIEFDKRTKARIQALGEEIENSKESKEGGPFAPMVLFIEQNVLRSIRKDMLDAWVASGGTLKK